ncbi:MAG TPA: sorbosone dehydrogenase family protein [Blastocatellia bacterium]|nr:sorbosone dehydrogenase family protein [Blastocatellia bacterium]
MKLSKNGFSHRLSAIVFALHLVVTLACAQSARNASDEASSKSAAQTSTLKHYDIKVADLPPPQVQRGPVNFSKIIPRPAGAELTLPPGFEISVYAEGDFQRPRWIALAPNGDVFVAEPGDQANSGRILVLRDKNNDGRADERFVFATGLMQPFGMAFWKDYFYVANTNAVVRFKYKSGQTKAEGPPEQIATLPGKGYREHWTRNIIFNPAGTKMYVTVGSETNVDVEPDPMRAAISEYNPDGTGHRIYASGTRNPIGLAFHPTTRELWAAVQERDLIGEDLVPDYVTQIKEGGFYGWPYAYIGPHEDPRRKGDRPDLVSKTIVPDVLIEAHSAVLGLVFYDGRMFPDKYRGDAFVALHGSWNRSKRTGYKIIRIKMKDGRAVGGYDDFVVGWMLGEDKPEVWGRPVGLLVLKDGSMLITDDGANKIWRVTYSKRK